MKDQAILPPDLVVPEITLERPRDPSHGDLATNFAMILAKTSGKKPMEIAQDALPRILDWPEIETAQIAKPGFINLRLTHESWIQELTTILETGEDYGKSNLGQGIRVNVEYVSANPTGPMHIGHCRGAVIGDALASLLAFAGFDVTREYYINDSGSQIVTLARSVHLRYRQALGDEIDTIPEGYYPGDYLKPVGQALAERYGETYRHAPESEWLERFMRESTAAMMDLIKQDLKLLNIHHDIYTSEYDLNKKQAIDHAYKALKERGLIYQGVLEKPKKGSAEDWNPRKQTLFAAKKFGDDQDRALKKADGSWTYFAADIAYHHDKAQRSDRLINIFGADHGGYVKRLQAAVKAMTDEQTPLTILQCQMVRLLRDGEPVKMSKRSGSFITLRDMVQEVGADALRFMMLTRKPEAQLDFDFIKVLEQSKDNPVFYVNYAHARICSILRRARREAILDDILDDSDKPTINKDLLTCILSKLIGEEELNLMKCLTYWTACIEGAARTAEAHRIPYYLDEVATRFHALWHKGNEKAEHRFITKDHTISQARILLCLACAQVLRSGLHIMGVQPVEEM